jgi:hypothetical protein
VPLAAITAAQAPSLAWPTHTPFASVTCGMIGLILLKLRALVKISARRLGIAFASARPYAQE